MEANTLYNRAFFDQQALRSRQSASLVLPEVFARLEPRRVIDIGCGVGPWLHAAQELGATEILGMDGDYVDRSMLMVDPGCFVPADLANQRLPDVLGPRAATPFDLVMCLEVAEHLPHERAPSFVEDLTRLGDAVLFSAAIPFQYGTNHINEQWPEFWAILFRACGFSCFDWLRSRIWTNPGIDWWYAQNTLLFTRDGSPAEGRLPEWARAAGRGLSLVHPETFLNNLLGLHRTHRRIALDEERNDLRALVHANLENATTLPPSTAVARARAAGAEARDVFPWTRNELSEPDAELDKARALAAAADEAARIEIARRVELADLAHAEVARRQACEALLRTEIARREELARAEVARREELERLLRIEAEQHRLTRQGIQDQVAAAEQRGEAAALQSSLDPLRQQLDAMAGSTTWRATRPLRAVGRRLPRTARRVLRGSARLAWWTLTLRLPARLAERRQRMAAWGNPEPQPGAAGPGAEDGIEAPDRDALPEPQPAAASPGAEDGIETPDRDALPEPQPGAAAPAAEEGIGLPDQSFLKAMAMPTIAMAVERLQRFAPFRPDDYIQLNPDVGASSVSAGHLVCFGAFEGRQGFRRDHVARVMGECVAAESAQARAPDAGVPGLKDEAEIADLVARSLPIGIHVSSHGNVFMAEIAEDLAADLRSAGVQVALRDERSPIEDRPPISVFVAPHEFFVLGTGGEWLREDVVANSFMFGTEQVQTPWFTRSLPLLLMSRGVIDICVQTADLLGRTSLPALHLLPGARLNPHRLAEQDRSHPLFQVLPGAAKAEPDPHTPFADRPIDIVFFGTASPYRDAFFARHAAFLSDYETFLYARRPERGPITGEEGALTRLAGHASSHAKITLNIHRDEFGYFEWHRMVRLGMCSGSVVVSDPCLPHPSFKPGLHYFQESARHIPDLLEWLLRTEDGRREAERVRGNVDRLISSTFDTKQNAAQLLEFLLRHRAS